LVDEYYLADPWRKQKTSQASLMMANQAIAATLT